jgi:hypothetical protein
MPNVATVTAVVIAVEQRGKHHLVTVNTLACDHVFSFFQDKMKDPMTGYGQIVELDGCPECRGTEHAA